jgi:hypothetical protein
LNVDVQTRTHKRGESLISAISAGVVFILIGLVFILALPSSLWDSIVAFFSNFAWRSVPGLGISLPAPADPRAYAVLYTAEFQFCIGLGILQVVLVAIRLAMGSPIRKTAETVGNLVKWFGGAYLITTYLNSTTTIGRWFMFWAGILIVLGLSLIARALVLLTKRI